MPNASMFNGPVVDVIPAIEEALIRAPQTSVAAPSTAPGSLVLVSVR
jgi:hypothetical protein